MNNIYKVIWSKAKNCYVVASEIARSHTKSASGSEKIGGVARHVLLALGAACAIACGGFVNVGAADTVHVDESSTPPTAHEVYTKAAVDTTFATKTEVNTKLDLKADKTDVVKNTTDIANNKDNINKLENNKLDKDVASATYATKEALDAKADETALAGKANTDLSNLTADGETKIKNIMSADMAKKADKTVVTALVGRVGNLETTVSDPSNGLVKKVADLNEKTTKITYDAALGTNVDGVTFNAGNVTGVTSINGIDIGDAQVDMKGKDLTGVGTINGTKIGTNTDGEYIRQDNSIWGNMKIVDTQVKTNADNIKTNTTAITTLDTKVGEIDDRTGGITRNPEKTQTTIEGSVKVDNQGNVKDVKGLSAETINTTGDAKVGGALNVTGESNLKNTTVDGTLTAKGEATFEKNVTMEKNLEVQGTLNTKDVAAETIHISKSENNPDYKSEGSIIGEGGKLSVSNEKFDKRNNITEKSELNVNEKGTVNWATSTDATGNVTKGSSEVAADHITNSVQKTEGGKTFGYEENITEAGKVETVTDKDGNKSTTKQEAGSISSTVYDKDGNIKASSEMKEDGSISNNATGDMTNTVGGQLKTTVTGQATEEFKNGLDTTVTGTENHKVNGTQNIHVTGKQTNTVEGGQENIISGGQINKITGDQTTEVTNGNISNTANNITNTANEKLTDQVGTNTRVIDSDSITDTVGTKTNRKIEDGKITDTAGAFTVTTDETNGTTFAKTGSTATYSTKAGAPTDTNIAGNLITTGRVDANELGVSDEDGDNTANLTVKAGEDGGVNASASKGTSKGSLDVKGDKVESSVKDGDKENTVTSTADGTTFNNSKANTAFEGGTYTDTTIKGNTITTGKVTMDYAEVMKDLGVTGKTTTGSLEVKGESKLTGNVTMENDATVEKNLTVKGTTNLNDTNVAGKLDVTKEATFHDSVHIDKNLSVDGNANILGDVTAKSYKVGGNTYIDANGINANNQKITNVADGSISEGSKDAVNGGQLYGVKRDLEHQVDKVGANAAAMANLRPMEFDPSSKWNIAAAIGNYGSETAAALGAFYRPNDNVMVNLSTAFGTGENMVGGGVSVRLGKGGNKLSREETNALKAQVADLTARMDALLSVLNPNMSKDFPDVPENHWAYEAVSRLAGNDIVQGYPDGEFHGERTMTRYEMAEIIYNALSRGAEAERELVEEFKPELQAMAASEKSTAEKAEG